MRQQARARQAAVDRSDGAGTCTMRWQHAQLSFGRTWRITLKRAGTYSSTSDTSSPIRASPRRSPGRCSRRVDHRSRGRCSGNGLRTGLRAGVDDRHGRRLRRAGLELFDEQLELLDALESFSEERPNCMRRKRASSSLSRSIQVRRYTSSCCPACSCASRACKRRRDLRSCVCRSMTSVRSAATLFGSVLHIASRMHEY